MARAPTARLTAILRDRVISAPDTWERHLIVARLIGAPRDLVDVGGLPGQLASFLPDTKVLAVNVTEPADMVVPIDRLPFADGTFTASTSLDVLEHIARGDRPGFIGEFLRVARDRTVLCCPLGTPQHATAEGEIQDWYRSLAGSDNPWLAEHLANGLPTLDELRAAYRAHGTQVRFFFHGDFRAVNEQFRRLMLARHRHRPGDLTAYARFRLAYRASTALSDEPTPYTNRVFAVTGA